MTDYLAWSHARLKQYLDCPKQLWHNIAPKGHPDRVEFKQTQAMVDGNAIDDALTKRIGKGVPLPPQFAAYEGLCAAVVAAPGDKFTQMEVTLDQAFKPVGWFDKSAWVRSKFDLAIVNGDRAFIGDWKNGQVWLDELQLKIFAAVGFVILPEVETIDTSYIWLKHGVTSDKTYRRREAPDLWDEFLPDVERIQVSHKTNHWPAQPKRGKATCKWCPANGAGKCAQAQGPYGR